MHQYKDAGRETVLWKPQATSVKNRHTLILCKCYYISVVILFNMRYYSAEYSYQSKYVETVFLDVIMACTAEILFNFILCGEDSQPHAIMAEQQPPLDNMLLGEGVKQMQEISREEILKQIFGDIGELAEGT